MYIWPIKRVAWILILGALSVGMLVPTEASAFYRRCGDTAYATDIAVKNMYCRTAKRYIRNWYARGKPMPRSFKCRLRSAPAKARCRKGRKVFSFRYAE